MITKVIVSIGPTASLTIDNNGMLIVNSQDEVVIIGRATQKRMTEIQELLERMKVFAEPD